MTIFDHDRKKNDSMIKISEGRTNCIDVVRISENITAVDRSEKITAVDRYKRIIAVDHSKRIGTVHCQGWHVAKGHCFR
jgi:hypothetical protein